MMRNWVTSSTKSLMAAFSLAYSPYFFIISLMNSDFILPKMHYISFRCISSLLENFIKISS